MKSSAVRSPTARKVDVGASAFAERLSAACAGRVLKQVADAVDVAPSTIQRYLAGSIPAADIAIKLARTLGVRVEWLIVGEGPMNHVPGATAGDAEVALQRFDVFAFDEYGKGPPVETVRVPAAWLMAAAKATTGLWLAEMPSGALPEVAREGETIICRDPETPLQDRRVYIFLLDGRPIVRRVAFQPNAVVLRGEDEADTITLRPEELEQRLMPAGRILATVRLDQV